MHRSIRIVACSLATVAAVAPAIPARAAAPPFKATRDISQFGRKLDRFVRGLLAAEGAPPGTAVVVVSRGKTVFARAYGLRDVRSRSPLTLHTPMYNGSVTKAYTGVLAAVLDADGTLPLSTTLADVWPQLKLAPPLEPQQITGARLLSHTGGFRDNGLQFRSVWSGQITTRDIPGHLTSYATSIGPQFRYQNLGPFVWSAMAEARTGVPWRELLKRKVLRPLRLRESYTSLEDAGPDRVALCHVRTGGVWSPQPPKPTATMNAAGGMYASAIDTAKFLQVAMGEAGKGEGTIPNSVLRRSWQKEADQDQSMWDLHRDGYGLGWDLGTIDGYRFIARSGSYPGCRAIMMYLPAERFGIVVMSNSGIGANTFDAAVVHLAIEDWTSRSAAGGQTANRLKKTREILAQAMKEAAAQEAALPPPEPLDPTVAREAVGSYRNVRLGDFDLKFEGNTLILSGGAFRAPVQHVTGDVFRVTDDGDGPPSQFTLIRSSGRRVVAFMWDDDRYDRL